MSMLEVDKCCLVVVDVQGKLAEIVYETESLLKNVGILIKIAKSLGFPVIWCQQNPEALGETKPELAELLRPDEPVNKFSFSCCGDEKFSGKLKALRCKQVILCGIETHVCIYQTAMDLLDKDCEVIVAADAVSSRTKENRQIALDRMRDEGAAIACTEMVLFELLKTAKHEKFRELARLIK